MSAPTHLCRKHGEDFPCADCAFEDRQDRLYDGDAS